MSGLLGDDADLSAAGAGSLPFRWKEILREDITARGISGKVRTAGRVRISSEIRISSKIRLWRDNSFGQKI